MALDTYDGLTAAIAAYLNRSDLTAVIPDFIRLAESRFQRDLKAFATRVTDYAVPLSSTTGQSDAIPGLQGVIDIESVGIRVVDAALAFNPPTRLQQVSPEQLYAWHETEPLTDTPSTYAVTGNTITTYPFPNVPTDSVGASSSYVLLLNMVGPTASFAVPISSANYASNPILAQYPDLYLYGALAESAPYLMDDERIAVWEARYRDAVKGARLQHDQLQYGSRPFRRELPVVFG